MLNIYNTYVGFRILNKAENTTINIWGKKLLWLIVLFASFCNDINDTITTYSSQKALILGVYTIWHENIEETVDRSGYWS